MTVQEAKHLAVEYAVSCLKAECNILNFGYEVDIFSIKTEWREESAVVYLTDGIEEVELAVINFEDVATVVKYPLVYTQKLFQDMAEKHCLIKTVGVKVEEGELEECQEMN